MRVRRSSAIAARFLVAGLIAGLLTTDAAGQVFDPVAEFSLVSNTDQSTWSYRFSTDQVRDGAYPLFATVSAGANFWNPDHPYWFEVNQFHGLGVNNSGASLTPDFGGFQWPDATIWMHPGTFVSGTPGGPGFSVLSWLAPGDGTIDISFTLADMDTTVFTSPPSNGVEWFVDLGDATGQIATGVFDNAGSSGLQIHNDIPVQAGDRLHFIVDPRNDNRFGDSTQFTGSVSFSPAIPATNGTIQILLAALLGGTLAFSRWSS